MSTSYNDGTYAGLIAAVLRARERTRCNNLAIAVRGERAALVLRIACADQHGRPGTFSVYATPFCSRMFLEMVEDQAEAISPERIEAHILVALGFARDPRRHTALTEALLDYRRAWPYAPERALA